MRKHLFFIGTLVIASIFAGCSKDKEEAGKDIIGVWKSDVVIEGVFGRTSPVDVKGRETLTFYADKRVEQYIAAYDYTYEGTYTINGSSS